MKNYTKVLELTNFSLGACGVWQRVKQESELLSENHEVLIMSSNAIKDSNEIAPSEDKIKNIKIKRFPFKKLGGESFMKWNFEKAALKYSPDIIITHVYRHPHTKKALKLKKILKKQGKKCKVFLVTHAPFVPDNSTRSFFSKIIVTLYDKFIGPKIINKFNKVIAITHWELPYLKKLNLKDKKIIYIPNGIPDEFFKQKKAEQQNKILFLGRISPIKNLETAILAINQIKDKNIIFELVGPADENYLIKLKKLVKQNNLDNRIKFTTPIYDLKKKIQKIDSCKIFILPSLREGMPQSLIEAMAREKIVIASDNLGSKDIIKDNQNGYIFKIGDEKDLADKINNALSRKSTGKQAKKSVEQFKWSRIIKKLEGLFSS